MSFQIFVKSINGKSRTIDVTPQSTIADVKQKLQETEGINTEEQRLIFAGKNLEDTRTIAEYNIGADSTIHLVLRVR